MKLAPTILFGLSLIPLSVDVWFLYVTYCELLQPTVLTPSLWNRNLRGESRDPLLGYWVFGNFVHLISTVVLLAAVYGFLDEKDDASPTSNSIPRTLIALANQPLLTALLPIFTLVMVYQIPFVLLFALYWRTPNQSGLALFASATVLTVLTAVLIRSNWRKSLIGDPRIELDDAPELPANVLRGRVVLTRQSDVGSRPLSLQLRIHENRMPLRTQYRYGNDNFEPRYLRELYWKFRFHTQNAIENPFEEETAFPFEASIPAWLPRPWIRSKDNCTIGIEWNVEASGSFAGASVSAVFPIPNVPASLKQPTDRRIRIPQEDLAPLLLEQSICWQRSRDGCYASIRRVRPPMIESIVFGGLFASISLGCMLVLWHHFDLFYLWGFLGSLVMSIAIFQKQFAYRVLTVDQEQRILIYERFVFGLRFKQAISRDEFALVFVQPVDLQWAEDGFSNFEYDIVLLFRRSNDEQLRVARIKYRLIAKALAQALASELEIPMDYRAANVIGAPAPKASGANIDHTLRHGGPPP